MIPKNFLLALPLLSIGCDPPAPAPVPNEQVDSGYVDRVPIDWNADSLIAPDEKHFSHLRKLTFGGNNAEAYWSFGGDLLSFQSDNESWGNSCDQIYTFDPFKDDLSKSEPQQLSSNGGRTTCSYFMPGDSLVLFASTASGGKECPETAARKPGGKYLWNVYKDYEIYVGDRKGNIRSQLTDELGYDAEATVSPKRDRIVFTSMRDGDLDLYTMKLDGSDVKRVTTELGYDGGAFFSPDGSKLVWRASRPKTKEEVKEYIELLKQGLVQPTSMELFVANADGTGARQITELGKANWAPSWSPDGKKIIFATNHTTERGFPFTLYMINLDGTGLERITHDDAFDAFPMFSIDGKYLVFSSNRGGKNRETNLFLAEWKN
ncbi:MAG: PD40 domain-containing protein [Flavobacteriales bacterium]|nr:PD40 domain-containing protein [Flavobacteriales bacterium]